MTPPPAPRTRLSRTIGLGLAGVSIVGAGLYFTSQRHPNSVPLFAKAPVETPAPASALPAAPVTTASITPPAPAPALITPRGDALNAIRSATHSAAVAPPTDANTAAYAPTPGLVPDIGPTPAPEKIAPAPQRADAPALREAIEAIRKGDLEKGESAAANALDDLGRNALRWAAVRLQPARSGPDRIAAFIDANPAWPTSGFLQSRLDDSLYAAKAKPAVVRARFAKREPATPSGRLALARTLAAEGKTKESQALARRVWREDDLGAWAEKELLKEFGDALTKDDHRFRAARLFYKEQLAAAMRVAAKLDKDYQALARARDAVARENASDKLMDAVPKAMRDDPTYDFARVQKLRRSAKYAEAAAVLKAQAKDPVKLVDGDAWWTERKMVARKLLDANEPQLAYEVAAGHSAQGAESVIEAEFHAGWIALRFLDKPEPARKHFDIAAATAGTPISRARAFYWQARAAEHTDGADAAKALYERAAEHSSVYYGQLARARLGFVDQPVRRATEAAEDDQRIEPVRAVELFESIGEKDLAFRLTVDLARELTDDRQIAALGRVLTRAQDARATLIVGKLASQRGIALDDIAFPTFGVPDFERIARSAETPLVYAIARQESAFQPQANSHAGAKGLMQMLPSTARRTAQRAGVPFDEKRLLQDPAFNAQLGAAHLTELMDEHGQSLILTFAAYNAGGHRVKQWIKAYGDPRTTAVDPIDWIERIPFTETRNYVQRVAENLGMYRARFGKDDAPRLIVEDLRGRETRVARAP